MKSKNPFIKKSDENGIGYVTRQASLNRVVLEKLPVYGIDNLIEKQTAFDVFSTWGIIEEIKRQAKIYSVSISGYGDFELPKFLSAGMNSDDMKTRRLCRMIATKYGKRLGLILLTLKTGLPENREARDDWHDEHWEYFKNLETVILCGGLASGDLGRCFKEQIAYVFDSANVRPYNIVLFESGALTGILGAASLVKIPNSKNLIFDFGQTNIKRCVVKKSAGDAQVIDKIKEFSALASINMWEKYDDEEVKRKEAAELHVYLKKIIYNTYKEAAQNFEDLSDYILISIANYVENGKLSSSLCGYEKLRLLSEDYEALLSEELSGLLHKKIAVRLIHDGTATGIYFKDYENAMCITLGTAFGSGFPDAYNEE